MALPKPYYQQDGITLYCGDWRNLCLEFEDDQFGLVLTDPPYNCGMPYGIHDDAQPEADYLAWLADLLTEARRLSRDGVVYFPGTKHLWHVPQVLALAGLRPHRLLGWHKAEYAGDKWAGGPACCWEPVVWASKVEKPHYNRIYGAYGRDFLVVNATHGNPFQGPHPCPKPLKVMSWLVRNFCPPSELLLDPCAGTGTTLRAAKDWGCRAVGIEIEERYCELAVRRLEQGVLAFPED